MTVTLLNILVEDLSKQLGDRQFYTIDDLYSLGFFGSKHAARMALKNKRIAFIRISPRRRVVPLAALLDYLRNNMEII